MLLPSIHWFRFEATINIELYQWNEGTTCPAAGTSITRYSSGLSCSNFPHSLQKNSVGIPFLKILVIVWHISRTSPEAAEIVPERKGADELLQWEYLALGWLTYSTGHFKDSNQAYPVTDMVKVRHRKGKRICLKSLRNSRTVLKNKA